MVAQEARNVTKRKKARRETARSSDGVREREKMRRRLGRGIRCDRVDGNGVGRGEKGQTLKVMPGRSGNGGHDLNERNVQTIRSSAALMK